MNLYITIIALIVACIVLTYRVWKLEGMLEDREAFIRHLEKNKATRKW